MPVWNGTTQGTTQNNPYTGDANNLWAVYSVNTDPAKFSDYHLMLWGGAGWPNWYSPTVGYSTYRTAIATLCGDGASYTGSTADHAAIEFKPATPNVGFYTWYGEAYVWDRVYGYRQGGLNFGFFDGNNKYTGLWSSTTIASGTFVDLRTNKSLHNVLSSQCASFTRREAYRSCNR